MKFVKIKVYVTRIQFLAQVLLILSLYGCSSYYLEDCPKGGVIGVDKHRIRSCRVRMLLGDEVAAANRFVDYAAMSAMAYAEPADQDCGNDPKVKPEDKVILQKRLNKANWERVVDAEYAPSCEDDVGLYYHVWKRDSAIKTEVVIAFRGTWGFNDWWYGNSYWVRRILLRNINMKREDLCKKNNEVLS